MRVASCKSVLPRPVLVLAYLQTSQGYPYRDKAGKCGMCGGNELKVKISSNPALKEQRKMYSKSRNRDVHLLA